jgi:hypothetical protein
VVFKFKYNGIGFATLDFNSNSGIGIYGTSLRKVDGKPVARHCRERTVPLIQQWGEIFDVGADTDTLVDDRD